MPRQRRTPHGPHEQFMYAVQSGIKDCGLSASDTLLVALSGGPDSTALLIALQNLFPGSGSGIPRIEVAHFNHQLRGDDSSADEEYCRHLCEQLGVPFHTATGDVNAHAVANGMSTEAAARDMRYRFFASTVSQHGFAGVATGHTTDDQAETILLAMTRGAGLRGLSGMSAVTERRDISGLDVSKPMTVFRPLLAAGVTGQQTAAFCETSGITPQVDSSNTDETFARNRIRHSVMPELRKINSAVTESLVTLAANAASAHEFIRTVAITTLEQARTDAHGSMSKHELLQVSSELLPYIVMMAFEHVTGTQDGLDKSHVDAMCGLLESGLETHLPGGWRMVADHDSVRIIRGDDDPACPFPGSVDDMLLSVPGIVRFEDGSTLSAKEISPVPDFSTLTEWQAVISANVAGSQLTVRSRQDGDRFQPLGMTGEMKLQDFVVNEHFPWWWRDRVPLVIAEGRILWVTGTRIAEWARVPADATSAVILEFTQGTRIHPAKQS
jgi:tRNA(Ile)-lysidine synthase